MSLKQAVETAIAKEGIKLEYTFQASVNQIGSYHCEDNHHVITMPRFSDMNDIAEGIMLAYYLSLYYQKRHMTGLRPYYHELFPALSEQRFFTKAWESGKNLVKEFATPEEYRKIIDLQLFSIVKNRVKPSLDDYISRKIRTALSSISRWIFKPFILSYLVAALLVFLQRHSIPPFHMVTYQDFSATQFYEAVVSLFIMCLIGKGFLFMLKKPFQSL